MQEFPSRNQEFSSLDQEKKMFVTPDDIRTEMATIVRDLAGPRQLEDNIKSMIARAARKSGMTYGKIKKFWYGEISIPSAHDAENLRRARISALANRCELLAAQLKTNKALLDAVSNIPVDLSMDSESL